jgi:nucleotide-binding universal stress UspA family protein
MKILVPLDGSTHAAEGIRIAARHAATDRAETTLLTVIPSVADIDLELSASERDRLLESMKQRGEELLARGRDQMRAYGVPLVSTVVLSAPSPAQEIVSFAERERIDLIVIGSQGKSANRRFALGGVAANVVRHSPCCVYVVRTMSSQ